MNDGRVTVDVVKDYETTLKPTEHPDDRRVRLVKELATFRVGLGILSFTCAASLYVGIFGATAEDRRWGQSVITLLVGGAVGFAFRK